MKTVILLVAVGYVALVGALYVFQRQLLYFPDRSAPDAALAVVPGLKKVILRTDDGLELAAWFRPAPSATAPVIVYLHGNGGHVGYRFRRAQAFVEAGFGLMMVEYRGYGGNPGAPSEAGLLSDARAGLARAVAESGGKARTVLYGESLGSGVAVGLAAEAPVAALVLEAPFTSIADVAQHHYPFVPARWLVVDRFDSAAQIGKIRAPVLILHGERDRVVPIGFGRALLALANEPKEGRFFPEAGHEDLYAHGALEAVRDFIARRAAP